MLGQSVLASADIHLVFEEAQASHHLNDGHSVSMDSDFSSLDDCGHSCHSHGSCVGLFSSTNAFFEKAGLFVEDNYNNLYHSLSTHPFLRPPIA
jgi:hypothetical protein